MTRFSYPVLILMLLFSTAALGKDNSSCILSQDWSGCTSGELPEGWSTEGTPKTPAGYAADYFSYGEGMKIMSIPDAEGLYATSYSTTLEGGKVNTRLMSPEIEIPESGAILSFRAVNYNPGGTAANKLQVYARDAESGREESVLMVRIPSGCTGKEGECVAPLTECSGRSISLVIVNEGTDAGLLGIGDIKIEGFTGEIYDTTPMMLAPGKKGKFAFSVGILAPCKGFTATLATSTGLEESYHCDENLDKGFSVYPLPFKSTISLKEGEIMEYTVVVTPDMDGAEPLTMQGSVGCGVGFPSVCVEEEGTGERCGFCPAGAAGIERFSDLYGDRYIGIGIHCTDAFSTGVMNAPSYEDPFVTNPRFPIEGLPAAVLNRSLPCNPTNFAEIDAAVGNVLEATTVAATRITHVGYDAATGDMSVEFSTSLAMPLPTAQLQVAAVLLSDNLTGSNAKWWQYDYYSGTTKEEFLKDNPEEWWPYMEFYCNYPATKISPTDLKFSHVAMGIYPDYYGDGCQLPFDWSDGAARASEISFAVPMQEHPNGFGVQDISDTSVVILVFDARTGAIIAADKLGAENYNKEDGVTEIIDDMAPNSNGAIRRTFFVTPDGILHPCPPRGLSIRIDEYQDGTLRQQKILIN